MGFHSQVSEIHLGKQKNVGVNTMKIAALNKREPVGEGLELARETKGSQSGDKGNRGAIQNIAAGEGLQLVRGTNGSQSGDKGNRHYKGNTVPRRSRFEKDQSDS